MKPEDICTITNRSVGSVLYTIPENHIRREFNAHETKRVPYAEILAVAQQPGGREHLYNYFYIKEIDAVQEALNIDMKKEVEYFITEDEIPGWMKTCTLDEFKDALDFAPDGIKNLIKEMSVRLPLTDTEKRDALKDQLDFDCEAAIKNERDTQALEPTEEAQANIPQTGRRATPASSDKSTTTRRVVKKTTAE